MDERFVSQIVDLETGEVIDSEPISEKKVNYIIRRKIAIERASGYGGVVSDFIEKDIKSYLVIDCVINDSGDDGTITANDISALLDIDVIIVKSRLKVLVDAGILQRFSGEPDLYSVRDLNGFNF